MCYIFNLSILPFHPPRPCAAPEVPLPAGTESLREPQPTGLVLWRPSLSGVLVPRDHLLTSAVPCLRNPNPWSFRHLPKPHGPSSCTVAPAFAVGTLPQPSPLGGLTTSPSLPGKGAEAQCVSHLLCSHGPCSVSGGKSQARKS